MKQRLKMKGGVKAHRPDSKLGIFMSPWFNSVPYFNLWYFALRTKQKTFNHQTVFNWKPYQLLLTETCFIRRRFMSQWAALITSSQYKRTNPLICYQLSDSHRSDGAQLQGRRCQQHIGHIWRKWPPLLVQPLWSERTS